MIRYALQCADAHEFEAWFGSSADYDHQAEAGLIPCPHCGGTKISKSPMAPAVVTRRDRSEAAAKLRRKIAEEFEFVGDRFAEEARAMHEGDQQERPIWGQATLEEAKALVEEGVPVAPLPAEITPIPPRQLN